MNTRRRYYRISERGFANEDTIYSVKPCDMCLAQKEIDRAQNDVDGWAYWLTRKAAEAHCARNRAAYRSGEANDNNPAGCTHITPYELSEWYDCAVDEG